ncbi:serine/threonine protein kinase, putative [Brugia malayi]|uniref:Bm5658 n=2 Tax=Brugia TaxID=6278 RepID=A0A0K0JJT2_BRUMA|nr:serine/threonine protein kinase, putative [Brugia malayi]CRZ24232.1 Bm5658 [Brugia malayi]VIO86100.1 serine/threonine protein kinase, putative [Brugia malayi]
MNWYSIQLKNSDIDKHLLQQFTLNTITISSTCNTFQYNDCIASCIGNGSFGFVYRGIESSTGKPVAIKKLSKGSIKLDELKVMRAIKSDYLVGFTDNCIKSDEDSSMYIIMELCDIDLDCHLKYHTADGTLSSHNLKRLIDNVIRGYNELYNCCIVHRDIKPQNILIKYREQNLIERAKISDFGISRILNDAEDKSLSNVAGTLYYMAPEVGANILRTHEYGHEVDIWSLGCVLYQCIMGKIPFNEQELCRMFLFVACDNYDAYDKPELSFDVDENIAKMINSQLEIDRRKRTTPNQLYNEICKWDSDYKAYNDNCLYMDDKLSYRSNYNITGID